MRGRGHKLAASGTLSIGSSIALGAGTNPRGTYVSRDGKNVYVTQYGTGTVAQLLRDIDTGKLTAMSPATVATKGGPTAICESPDGAFVYITNAGYDNISMYSRNSSTGALTPLSTQTAASAVTPMGIAMSPDGLHVYVACRNAAGTAFVQQYSRNASTGLLTSLGTIALAASAEAHGVVITPDGKYVYVGTFGQPGRIYAFTRDSSSGLLTANAVTPYYATVSTTAEPAWLAVSPEGTHLYAAYDGTAQVAALSISATDGSLTFLGVQSTAGGPWFVAITPNGQSVYVACSDAQYISQFTRDPVTGLLTPKTPALFRSEPNYVQLQGSGGPQTIAISPDGKHAYCSCSITPCAIPTLNINP
jgi:DNA-binding beta-propeller fold protein YncE